MKWHPASTWAQLHGSHLAFGFSSSTNERSHTDCFSHFAHSGTSFLMGCPHRTSLWPHWGTKDQWQWKSGMCGGYKHEMGNLKWQWLWMEGSTLLSSPQPVNRWVEFKQWHSHNKQHRWGIPVFYFIYTSTAWYAAALSLIWFPCSRI